MIIGTFFFLFSHAFVWFGKRNTLSTILEAEPDSPSQIFYWSFICEAIQAYFLIPIVLTPHGGMAKYDLGRVKESTLVSFFFLDQIIFGHELYQLVILDDAVIYRWLYYCDEKVRIQGDILTRAYRIIGVIWKWGLLIKTSY